MFIQTIKQRHLSPYRPISSILTGLWYYHHGLRDNAGFAPKEKATIAEVLSYNGYQTGAFVSAYVLHHLQGLDQGFDVFRSLSSSRYSKGN